MAPDTSPTAPHGAPARAILANALQGAAAELASRPMRSGLTLAGFVVSMVIAVVLLASGNAVQDAVSAVLKGLGEGQISAAPGRTTGVGGVRRSGRNVRLRYDELRDIRTELPAFEGVSPFFDLRGGGATSRRFSIPWSPVRAVGTDYLKVRRLPLSEGRWFSDIEERDGEWVCVLNQGLRDIIFRDGPAVGEWVEWRGRRMTVVGVVRDDALFPYILFIPYETVRNMADARYVSGLIARPDPRTNWEDAVAELRRSLAGIGDFDPNDESALEITSNQDYARRVRLMTSSLRTLVVTIAVVGLLLGGLGVANMMVISVTERTREIGLRRAVGATRRVIFFEVFLEALALTAAGGGIGLVLGALACSAIGDLPVSTTHTARLEFDLNAALAALAVLGAVGTVAAIMPARRAVARTAAEALRWD